MRNSVWKRTEIIEGVGLGAQFEERVVCPLCHLTVLTKHSPSLRPNQISS